MKRFVLFIFAVLFCFNGYAQEKQNHSGTYTPNIAQGEKLYQNNCANCHGTKGMGDASAAKNMLIKPVALGDPVILNQLSPEKVFDVLTHGKSDRGMPSFKNLPEKDRWDLAAYIFTLNCNFQRPSAEVRPSMNWMETRAQTDAQLIDTLKRRGVPEKFIQRELSAARYILE